MTNGELLKDEISSAWNKFQTSQPHDRSVEQNWCHFTSIILTAIKNHVPTKTISSRWNLPWITPGLRRQMKKKQRGYNLAKRTQNPQHWKKFKELRKTWKWSLLLAHNDYVLGLLGWSDKKNSPFIGKKFWTYIKSKRKDNVGISSLNSGNTEITDNKAKAEILSNQFKAVFTDEDVDTIPDMDSNGVSDIGQLVSQTKGIYIVSLLRNINKKKASGPDGISCWVLKEAEEEIAPFLQFIFNQSLTTSQVPGDWKCANVTTVFKKGSKKEACNYRPVSLTYVPCKILEHIIFHHIMGHLDAHHVLVNYQHGFRQGHSCESQLITIIEHIARNLEHGKHVLLLDFSKAFDTVPHKRLLKKLDHYGIHGQLIKWIESWLCGRTQSCC